MRLTLRTLLAYLDNTLDKEDAEALRLKLSESGFATQLVQRIRGTLTNGDLTAPAHDAVNPIAAEANVISEYLDSTLATEQVAEIERICLDSDIHLAEAAACHQILTMVLGKPADVPDTLRSRIYELPDRKAQNIAAKSTGEVPPTGSFASVTLPTDANAGVAADVPGTVLQSSAPAVEPVGPSDSGVRDAPNRIRESGTIEDENEAIAGGRRRDQIEKSDLYGGIRASRVTPWLVSLALAGVFLFSLVKILNPLLNPVAQKETGGEKMGDFYPELTPIEKEQEDIVVSAADAPLMEPVGTPAVDILPSETETPSDTLELPAPSPSETISLPPPKDPAVDETAGAMTETPTEDLASAKADPDPNIETLPLAAPAEVDAPTADKMATEKMVPEKMTPDGAGTELPNPDKQMSATDEPKPNGGAIGNTSAVPDPLSMSDSPKKDVDPDAPDNAAEMKSNGDPDDPNAKMEDPDSEKPAMEAGAELEPTLASLTSGTSLLFTKDGDDWKQVVKDTGLTASSVLVNAPKNRSSFSIGKKATVELVDATQIHFVDSTADGEITNIDLDFGRLLIKSIEPDVTTQVRFGGESATIQLLTADSIAAVEIRYARRPGFDAFSEKNHLRLARVVNVQGDVKVMSNDGDEDLVTGKQWMIRGSDQPKVVDVPSTPEWIDASNQSPLDASARSGLMELVKKEQPLHLSMLEATQFRKSEVAALAAQCMLYMDRADVFFGTDGVLSKAKQRTYWKDHFAVLRSAVDQSPESAKGIIDSIGKMDTSDGAALFRLLTGFSQNQLVEGADQELVDMLDSGSMSVRVLALENLREITGVNLNYRPEEENAMRRKSAVKKWQVRQRKGDIRWP